MPIYKGTLKTGAAYKGNVSLSRIYKGAYLVFEAFKTLIAEGVPPLTLLNCVAEIMLGYRIYGNSIQDGTPAPDTPIEIESVGDKTKNIWDEQWEVGVYSSADGAKANANNRIRSKNYIPVYPSTKYYFKSNANATIYYYDINKTFIEYSSITTAREFTTPNNAYYINFNLAANSGSTYNDDICISISDLTNGTYEPYGYRIPVKNASPNLLPYPYTLNSGTQGGIEITVNDDGSIKLNGTSTGISPTINTFRLKAGKYTISGNPSPDVKLWLRVVGSMSSADYVSNYNGIKGTLTIAQDSDMYVYITVSKGVTLDNAIIYPMVNEGTMDLEYSKYFAPETTNIYLDEPLRKIGNYIDYIDFETGKVYRNVKKINLSTTLPRFSFSTSWDNEDYTTCYFSASDIGFSGIMSNYFKTGISYQSNVYDNQIVSNYGNKFIYIKIAKAIATSKTELNNWLNTLSTPVEIIYQLASTTEESIELPDILLNKGTNVIDVETSITPSNMWIKYKSK